ncbi:MAG: hypothetical protein MR987_00370 [Oscillospiraceae bacterium]|nr:hypothetical protein [Oscillospiraceae bacterium]
MSTALSTGRTGGEPSVSESAAGNRGRRAERERERRRKVAQRAFAAAGNRRTETEGGEPGVSESAAERSHKEPLPPP